MTINLLGRLAVDVDGTAADVARLGHLGRLAFAYLVLERRRPVPRDELADVLWGEDLPATWESSLRGVLSRVRGTLTAAGLPAGTLASRLGCYQLELPAGSQVDVEAVTTALTAAESDLAAAPERARPAAETAARLAALQLLPGAPGTWVERRQDELAAARVRALEVVAASASAVGDAAAAVAAAEEAVALAPLQESAHQRLIAAHARAGDRAAALNAYSRWRDALSDELGVDPSPETEALYLSLLGDGETVARPSPTNLPADRTSFVGRETEVGALSRLLGTTRLLTLTGPGGVGKSRLAIRLARGGLDTHPDGVWMVELAALADPSLVPQHVLAVLGAPEVTGCSATEALTRHLAGRRLLLVLDNCEHVVGACAELCDRLLSAAPHLRIVATSREPVAVPGEITWSVPPLPEADATRLFRERARAAAPSADLGPAAAEAVARICARVDGIPLAVELAAARARALSVPEIAARLDDRLGLLVGGPRTVPSVTRPSGPPSTGASSRSPPRSRTSSPAFPSSPVDSSWRRPRRSAPPKRNRRWTYSPAWSTSRWSPPATGDPTSATASSSRCGSTGPSASPPPARRTKPAPATWLGPPTLPSRPSRGWRRPTRPAAWPSSTPSTTTFAPPWPTRPPEPPSRACAWPRRCCATGRSAATSARAAATSRA